ncbi:hypothetical protein B0J14DRAFT_342806 [Halenospora varia]|nr:hypothetical protein B0J14DRAFT_342806 [Halenospora varia]
MQMHCRTSSYCRLCGWRRSSDHPQCPRRPPPSGRTFSAPHAADMRANHQNFLPKREPIHAYMWCCCTVKIQMRTAVCWSDCNMCCRFDRGVGGGEETWKVPNSKSGPAKQNQDFFHPSALHELRSTNDRVDSGDGARKSQPKESKRCAVKHPAARTSRKISKSAWKISPTGVVFDGEEGRRRPSPPPNKLTNLPNRELHESEKPNRRQD